MEVYWDREFNVEGKRARQATWQQLLGLYPLRSWDGHAEMAENGEWQVSVDDPLDLSTTVNISKDRHTINRHRHDVKNPFVFSFALESYIILFSQKGTTAGYCHRNDLELPKEIQPTGLWSQGYNTLRLLWPWENMASSLLSFRSAPRAQRPQDGQTWENLSRSTFLPLLLSGKGSTSLVI